MKIDELITHAEGIDRDDLDKETFELVKIALATLKAHKQGLHYRDEQGRFVITELDEILGGLE